MPTRRRLTAPVHLSLPEWDRLERLNTLVQRAVDLVGDTGAINYPEAIAIVRSLADEAPP